MVKFSITNFLEATADTHQKPALPEPVLITPANLRLPVAPPSPQFEGINLDIDTEPFPDYIDIIELEDDPTHCTASCSHTVCVWVSMSDSPPQCYCHDDEESSAYYEHVESLTSCEDIEPPTSFEGIESSTPLDNLPAAPNSTVRVNYKIISQAQQTMRFTSPTDTIEIQSCDAQSILLNLETYLLHSTSRVDELGQELDIWFPAEGADEAVSVCDFFFTNMQIYILRTISKSEPRILTVKELCTELEVYLWTMLREYVEAYSVTHELDYVSKDVGPWTVIDENLAPGMVSAFWKNCGREIVALLVFHSRKVEKGLSQAAAMPAMVGENHNDCEGFVHL
jgi:hypothetical protein